ncbi:MULTISPECIES: hypothetical protein [unclassified Campylobacter]|uniref:hypothetical protein n=1 Tax=unclassified Campylobacter TaxID=2593542 RepID=UPI001237CA10|nr:MULTISPECIES: hypothetical protein [unclassified Campylobacter]KAA6224603.1 hypothetical protein FMM54_08110 [Campylobacter sp. LR185c]KAA6224845.1 hypothetical protein FMM57_08385 [Campylobacter sp. LR286c]KAA6227992.1 hypothetical protein FMM55_02155 [Campylobacter sp. LR196d]KAA6233473.1 hypothetical protein FMM58_02080 [Campylobacter sp. LR291e]KAA6234410.1 hypothetical protein FMM56_00785 [Campylobacter sp. LR264d]
MSIIFKGGLIVALFFIQIFAQESLKAVIYNENVLNQKVSDEINLIGKEVFDKTGIFIGVAVSKERSVEDLIKMQEDLPRPNILLMLSISSQKVDIIGTKEALTFFDKEAVLSPYASTGTILPILASKKGDIYNAAIINGYGDITDRIAKYFNISLEHSIGNSNKDTLNILRILIYGFICFALIYYIQRRIKRRKNV